MMRSDFAAIAEWVAPGSQVLDVGCGDGRLLHHLKIAKQAHVYGVELADDKVLACAQKGLNVVQQNLEGGLALFEDQSFDKVILSQTIQTSNALVLLGPTCTIDCKTSPQVRQKFHRLSVMENHAIKQFKTNRWC